MVWGSSEMTLASSDECFWRSYPPSGIIKYETLNPDYYPYADTLETLANHHFRTTYPNLIAQMQSLTARLVKWTTLYSRDGD
jgi:hypothetical protein